MSERYLEDFVVGAVLKPTGRLRVEKAAIIAFAKEFDPQPFHLDEKAGRKSIFRGLVASGWHTAAMTMRLVAGSEYKPAGGKHRARLRHAALAASGASRRRVAYRDRSARGAHLKIAPGSRTGQAADANDQSGRRDGAGTHRHRLGATAAGKHERAGINARDDARASRRFPAARGRRKLLGIAGCAAYMPHGPRIRRRMSRGIGGTDVPYRCGPSGRHAASRSGSSIYSG